MKGYRSFRISEDDLPILQAKAKEAGVSVAILVEAIVRQFLQTNQEFRLVLVNKA